MSIRPSYGKRSVLQALGDGMSQYSQTGKSCCEDAALNAAEVDRLTSEREELHGYIAEYREMWGKQLRRADCAETDLDLMREVLAEAEDERDELRSKLEAAENRPTLDREAVKKIVVRESLGIMTDRMDDALTDAIMALADPAKGAEDERIEKQAKALGAAVSRYHGDWGNFSESARERYRAAIRAGWTKEDQ